MRAERRGGLPAQEIRSRQIIARHLIVALWSWAVPLQAAAVPHAPHGRASVAGQLGLRAEIWRGCHVRLRVLPGVQPEAHALALSFLHHHAQAKDEGAVSALPELHRSMDMMPTEAAGCAPRAGRHAAARQRLSASWRDDR